ncbi:uncharacterized protein LOC121924134 isoform X3 [Sceloporus undulatus]|uniref:uncharacterized protein LOC121924134 isoform X3 n=1 Tax=Sceloporus undulatus TaxID=8520 RepID=UPI001C4D2AF8|nr:uncharacterized protein LOC121924134 isoform X3 [Sceloporus undulatus]
MALSESQAPAGDREPHASLTVHALNVLTSLPATGLAMRFLWLEDPNASWMELMKRSSSPSQRQNQRSTSRCCSDPIPIPPTGEASSRDGAGSEKGHSRGIQTTLACFQELRVGAATPAPGFTHGGLATTCCLPLNMRQNK